MASNVTVLYKQAAEGEYFDMEYYVNSHMPLVDKLWAPFGLKSWEVIKFGPEAPFYGGALMTWEKAGDAAKMAVAPESQPLYDDVPNFTNLKPIVMTASIESRWDMK
ncbi:hypothetical protein Trco_008490 [Trichoderma cornu-damae]|uniref:EthD domain-containing protein n=1 Tax=Trichoderma cornu-damae TaxID=654480 RepID=A0A9P8QFG3_9HYPO|nr:hypothetical protein Trco_008490 [Trichoderma cornu-damae]